MRMLINGKDRPLLTATYLSYILINLLSLIKENNKKKNLTSSFLPLETCHSYMDSSQFPVVENINFENRINVHRKISTIIYFHS